jgi:hypothetical protein
MIDRFYSNKSSQKRLLLKTAVGTQAHRASRRVRTAGGCAPSLDTDFRCTADCVPNFDARYAAEKAPLSRGTAPDPRVSRLSPAADVG